MCGDLTALTAHRVVALSTAAISRTLHSPGIVYRVTAHFCLSPGAGRGEQAGSCGDSGRALLAGDEATGAALRGCRGGARTRGRLACDLEL